MRLLSHERTGPGGRRLALLELLPAWALRNPERFPVDVNPAGRGAFGTTAFIRGRPLAFLTRKEATT